MKVTHFILPPLFEKPICPAGPSENEIPLVINRQVCAMGVFRSQTPRAYLLQLLRRLYLKVLPITRYYDNKKALIGY